MLYQSMVTTRSSIVQDYAGADIRRLHWTLEASRLHSWTAGSMVALRLHSEHRIPGMNVDNVCHVRLPYRRCQVESRAYSGRQR